MRLTAFTDYTLRTLIYLGLRPDRLVTIAEVAAAYDISVNHLMKVVHHLALAGDIATLRGQHGGLRLGRSAREINIGAIVRRTEPDMELAPCFGSGATCPIHAECTLAGALDEALRAFLAVLDRYTLADLISRQDALRGLLGISRPDQPASGR